MRCDQFDPCGSKKSQNCGLSDYKKDPPLVSSLFFYLARCSDSDGVYGCEYDTFTINLKKWRRTRGATSYGIRIPPAVPVVPKSFSYAQSRRSEKPPSDEGSEAN